MSKDFSVGRTSRKFEERGETRQTLEVDDIFKSVIKISSHSVNEEQLWLEHASWIDMDDSILALLLPALVNLAELDLKASQSVYVERMIKRIRQREKPFHDQPPLAFLTSFRYTGIHIDGMGPNSLAWSLQLRLIHTICGSMTEGEESFTGRSKSLALIDPASSLLTHLELQDCRLSMTDITKLLGIPKALKTFIYEPASIYRWCFDVSTTAIRDALRVQEHSLEKLWLDIDPFHDQGLVGSYKDVTPMTPFTSFQKLKFLRIQTLYVFGADIDRDEEEDEKPETGNDWRLEEDGNEGEQKEKATITKNTGWNSTSRRRLTSFFPSTLETLHFTRCRDHLPRLLLALEDLLECKSEQVPVLNKLILEADFHGEDIDEDRLLWGLQTSLVAQGRKQGVLVIFIHMQDFSYSICSYWNPVVNQDWRMDREWNRLSGDLDEEWNPSCIVDLTRPSPLRKATLPLST